MVHYRCGRPQEAQSKRSLVLNMSAAGKPKEKENRKPNNTRLRENTKRAELTRFQIPQSGVKGQSAK